MQLRRFTGDSAPLALGAVREALGDEAIILSNRQVDGRVEIVATAMLDERALAAAEAFESVSRDVATETTPDASAALAAIGAEASARVNAETAVSRYFGDDPTDVRAAPSAGGVEVPSASVATTVTPWIPPSATALEPPSVECRASEPLDTSTKLARPMPALPPHGAAPSDALSPAAAETRPLTLGHVATPSTESGKAAVSQAAPAANAIEAVLARIEHAQKERDARLEERLRRLEVNLWGEIEPLKAAHLRQLLRLGIGAELGVRLAESVASGTTREAAMRRSLALLKASLPVGADDTGEEPGVTVLSGPVGGGKTTALVKLATRHVQHRGNQSLVMIAADNRRIGAFESLQVYGRLLGVPVVQAHDGEELASLIEAFAHKYLVLVDHVPSERRETMPIPPAKALGSHDGKARRLRHLMVLPATLESRVFEAHVERHVEQGITAGVLTQLDRARRLGTCFAPLVRHQLGIAYWSDNPRVQTPLERASASVLVATAMATGAQLVPSADEELLLDLLQPTRRDVGETLAPGGAAIAVSAAGAVPDSSPDPSKLERT